MGNTIFTSETAQVIISIIPIVGIAIGGIVVFSIFSGTPRSKCSYTTKLQNSSIDLQTFSLLTGLLLTAIGFMLTLLFAIVEKGFSYVLLGGLIPLAIGVSLLIFYKVNPAFKVKDDKSEN